MKILVINPGSTSTKAAVFNDETMLFQESIRHSAEELSQFPDIFSQLDYRRKMVRDFLDRNGVTPADLAAIAARGGPLPPAEGGTYAVNDELLEATRNHYATEHPSLLAVLIADSIGRSAGIPSYMSDPVSVDEWEETARFSGMPELPRISLSHALNMRAVARRAASEMGRSYEELNLIIVHLGGGISVSAHCMGRQIDSNNANEDGPFAPERTGTLPAGQLVKLCFSGRYDQKQMKDLITRKGGMTAYLGINNAGEALKNALSGDKLARQVLESMMYQVSKEVGKMAAVLKGSVNAIVVSGGIAHNAELVDMIRERVQFIAPMVVYPGEDEMLALVQSALRVLRGEEKAKNFGG
ncbi:MAG: butyrate kinase, partial [Candidatus Wallbacteria bacterium]|nr:butyrate kinase [Candidatus Wallbacteria bacterium]